MMKRLIDPNLVNRVPWTVAIGARVVDAIVLLFTRGFRHLPVVKAGLL